LNIIYIYKYILYIVCDFCEIDFKLLLKQVFYLKNVMWNLCCDLWA